MTRIRIAPDGTVQGLWTDEIDWTFLGKVAVKRASHVEFCERQQRWHVRRARSCNALQLLVAFVLRRSGGDVLHGSRRRQDALAWERDYFSPGGPGWMSERELRKRDCHRRKTEVNPMETLRQLIAFLTGSSRTRQRVRDHHKQQAVGPRWSRHRPRRIGRYTRRKPRT